jgi:phage-related minor tail protein
MRTIFDGLAAARTRRATAADDLRDAEAALAGAQQEVSELGKGLKDREMELASSGGTAPDEPFDEEVALSRACRRERVCVARVELCRSKGSSIAAEIAGLKDELRASWSQFQEDGYNKARADFRQRAVALRESYINLLPWAVAMGNKGFAGLPFIEFQMDRGTANEITLQPRLVDAREWQSGELNARIVALREEIDEACDESS